MSGKQEHYPVELKLEAVRMFYEESKMYQEITTALGICDPRCTQKWMRISWEEGTEAFSNLQESQSRSSRGLMLFYFKELWKNRDGDSLVKNACGGSVHAIESYFFNIRFEVAH